MKRDNQCVNREKENFSVRHMLVSLFSRPIDTYHYYMYRLCNVMSCLLFMRGWQCDDSFALYPNLKPLFFMPTLHGFI